MSRIKYYINGINLSYDVLPYLYVPLVLLAVIGVSAWVVWGNEALLWIILILATYVILLTQFHLYGTLRKDLENHQKKVQAYFSLFSMLQPRDSLPYMTEWAATPELALALLGEIRHTQPDSIVEIGSGISTIISSYGLQKNGQGKVFSLDHDQVYAQKTREQLKRHGVEVYAEVVDAPLVTRQINGSSWQWYDINSDVIPDKIDLLLVDGPPVKTDAMARYPALPLLHERLSEHAAIILHDAHRPSEKQTLQKWQQQFPEFSCETVDSEKGIALLRRQAATGIKA